MRNRTEIDRFAHDCDSNTEVCGCCGGQFYDEDTMLVFREGTDGGPNNSLIICGDCSEQAMVDIRLDFETDHVNAEDWPLLIDWAKRQKILAFIPAVDQINDTRDVADFFDALTGLLVWHPDTDFTEYVYQDGHPKAGQPVFSQNGGKDSDVEALNECMDRCFEIAERERKSPRKDLYELGMEALQRSGKAPDPLAPWRKDAEWEDYVRSHISDWKQQVANGDTVLGLNEWSQHKHEAEKR